MWQYFSIFPWPSCRTIKNYSFFSLWSSDFYWRILCHPPCICIHYYISCFRSYINLYIFLSIKNSLTNIWATNYKMYPKITRFFKCIRNNLSFSNWSIYSLFISIIPIKICCRYCFNWRIWTTSCVKRHSQWSHSAAWVYLITRVYCIWRTNISCCLW